MKSLGQLVSNLVGIFIRWFYKSLSTRKKQEAQRCQTGWCLFLYVESLLSEFAKPSIFLSDRRQISAGPSKLLMVLHFTNISELFCLNK